MYDWEANKKKLLDSTGRKLTVGLFVELTDNPATAVFMLSDWREKYVAISDPTDYKAAAALIGSWDHWQALVANKAFNAELVKWREEVHVKLKSEALDLLRKHAKGPQGTGAAKWLAEGGLSPRKPGRPKKEEEDEPETNRVSADAKRLGFSVVKK
jgi:hypothetical protein